MRLLPLILSLLLSACSTTLKVQPANGMATRVGIPYPMMYTSFQFDVTRTLVECAPVLKVLVTVDAKGQQALPDPANVFMIDPNSLSSPLKTGTVKLTYHPNGAVAAFNAEAEDHAKTIVSDVLSAGFKLATLMAGAGAAPGGVQAGDKGMCTDEAYEARKAVIALQPRIATATALLEDRTAQLELISDKMADMGAPDEKTKLAYSRAYDKLVKARTELGQLQEALAKPMKVLKHVQAIRWPGNDAQFDGHVSAPASVLARWSHDINGFDRTKVDVAFGLKPVSQAAASQSWEAKSPGGLIDASAGLPYRTPLRGRVLVCLGQGCTDSAGILLEQEASVLQLGPVFYFPCQSRPFTSVSCEMEMTETGALKSIGRTNKSASGEAMASLAKDAVMQYSDYRKARSEIGAKRDAAELASLKAKAELAQARAALEPPTPGPTDAILKQTAVLKANTDLVLAEKAQLDAELALRDARLRTLAP